MYVRAVIILRRNSSRSASNCSEQHNDYGENIMMTGPLLAIDRYSLHVGLSACEGHVCPSYNWEVMLVGCMDMTGGLWLVDTFPGYHNGTQTATGQLVTAMAPKPQLDK